MSGVCIFTVISTFSDKGIQLLLLGAVFDAMRATVKKITRIKDFLLLVVVWFFRVTTVYLFLPIRLLYVFGSVSLVFLATTILLFFSE